MGFLGITRDPIISKKAFPGTRDPYGMHHIPQPFRTALARVGIARDSKGLLRMPMDCEGFLNRN